jgi:hypothetical protein
MNVASEPEGTVTANASIERTEVLQESAFVDLGMASGNHTFLHNGGCHAVFLFADHHFRRDASEPETQAREADGG